MIKIDSLEDIFEYLKRNQEEEYRKFNQKMIVNIDKDKILGVRIKYINDLVKELSKKKNENIKEKFLKNLPHKYNEENILHMKLITKIKDFEETIKEINRFSKYLDNWSVIDIVKISSLDNIKNIENKKIEEEILIKNIEKYIKSNNEHIQRLGIILLMKYFSKDNFKEKYLEKILELKTDKYYVQMAIAWYIQVLALNNYEKLKMFFEKDFIENPIKKMSIQKISDSLKISKEKKEYFKSFR